MEMINLLILSDYRKMKPRILMGVMDWNALPKRVTDDYDYIILAIFPAESRISETAHH